MHICHHYTCSAQPKRSSKEAHLEALLYAAPRILRLGHRSLLARCRRRQLSCYECTAACTSGWSSGALRAPARLLLLLLLLLGLLCSRRLLALLPLLWTLDKGLECGLLLSCCCRASRCRTHSCGPSWRRPCCCAVDLRLLSTMQKALRGWQEFTLLLAAVGNASLLLLLVRRRRRQRPLAALCAAGLIWSRGNAALQPAVKLQLLARKHKAHGGGRRCSRGASGRVVSRL